MIGGGCHRIGDFTADLAHNIIAGSVGGFGNGRSVFLSGLRMRQRIDQRDFIFLALLLKPLLFLLQTALAVAFDLPVRNVVHHHGGGFGTLLKILVLKVIPWAVPDCPNHTGHRNLHRSKQRQRGGGDEYHVGQEAAAGPAHAHGEQSAEKSAGDSGFSAGQQIGKNGSAARERPIIDNQVINGTSQQHEYKQADAAHPNRLLSAEHKNHEQVQQAGNGNVKSRFPDETADHVPHQNQQFPLRFHAGRKKYNKQNKADNTQRNPNRQMGICLNFRFRGCLIFLFSGRSGFFRPAAGFLLHIRHSLLCPGSRFLFRHDLPPHAAERYRINESRASPRL